MNIIITIIYRGSIIIEYNEYNEWSYVDYSIMLGLHCIVYIYIYFFFNWIWSSFSGWNSPWIRSERLRVRKHCVNTTITSVYQEAMAKSVRFNKFKLHLTGQWAKGQTSIETAISSRFALSDAAVAADFGQQRSESSNQWSCPLSTVSVHYVPITSGLLKAVTLDCFVVR